MSKKGVSAEEKRNRMLQLFHEKGECFQLKELEKIAPKEKGIVANSVKDVVQKLVEDNLVDTDKIGGSIYFWAFPSKSFISKKKSLAELENRLEEASKKYELIEKTVLEPKVNDDIEEKLLDILGDVNDREIELKEMENLLEYYQQNNPKKIEEHSKQTQGLKDATNRWTDNIFSVKSWCKKKFFIEDNILNKQLGIPDDFDYID